tara:strand:- start:203 stop:574 length:372 start_codon:yes stop_codon:yes gene_type:complete
MKDQLNISDKSKISMPLANLVMVIGLVGTVVLMWSTITQRIISLETSRELFLNDLLKKSDQKVIDQEQFLILEHLDGKQTETEDSLKTMANNTVMIEFLEQQLTKALKDIELLKDKVRANGNH